MYESGVVTKLLFIQKWLFIQTSAGRNSPTYITIRYKGNTLIIVRRQKLEKIFRQMLLTSLTKRVKTSYHTHMHTEIQTKNSRGPQPLKFLQISWKEAKTGLFANVTIAQLQFL